MKSLSIVDVIPEKDGDPIIKGMVLEVKRGIAWVMLEAVMPEFIPASRLITKGSLAELLYK